MEGINSKSKCLLHFKTKSKGTSENWSYFLLELVIDE